MAKREHEDAGSTPDAEDLIGKVYSGDDVQHSGSLPARLPYRSLGSFVDFADMLLRLCIQTTAKHPRKAMYRARAHSNPFNDPIYDVPACPSEMDW